MSPDIMGGGASLIPALDLGAGQECPTTITYGNPSLLLGASVYAGGTNNIPRQSFLSPAAQLCPFLETADYSLRTRLGIMGFSRTMLVWNLDHENSLLHPREEGASVS